MLSSFDYLVVAFYLCFLLSIGWFFRHTGKDTSEYFRGGGKMSWWMVGASGFMGAFSAWTFTGAAGLAYDHGFIVIILYWANALGFLINWTYFARMSRNTRAITALEAVRARLGPINEQVFTWLQVPFQVLQAGIWLYGLAIFCTPVFGLDLHVTIWVCGVVVVFVAAAGGSWAVVAGDFIQALVLVPITLVAAYTAIDWIGGVGEFVTRLPASHWDLTAAAADFGPWWIIAVILEKITNINGLNYSSRYLCVSDSRAARKAAMFSALLFLVGSVFWFIPPLAARAGGLVMATQAGVSNPAEMSYIVIAARCLPVGLLGLLVTGIISSTLSSMDSGLNRNAGIFVRSFYLPILRPRAGEKELVLAGRLTTWGFGGLAIVMALFYSSWQDLGVFQLMMNFSALVATPYAVPLFWCLLVRRSPDWAAWSTIVVCCVVGGVVSLLPTSAWAATLAPGKIAMGIAWARDHGYAAITLANVALGSLWFLGAAALTKRRALTPKRSAQVEQFFRNVDTDITPAELDHPDDTRHRGIAQMCLVYGAFIALLAVISPTWSGRFWLLFCALFMLGVGAAIRRATRPRPDVPPTAP
jgi:Na+/proline symporter